MGHTLSRSRLLALVLCVLGAGPALAGSAPFPVPTNLDELLHGSALDEGAQAMLRRNGFVVLDSVTRDNLQAAYPPSARSGVFVTTDALLHLWYLVHRDLLQAAERQSLYPGLRRAILPLAETAARLRARAADAQAGAALTDAAVTLAVAQRLLVGKDSAPRELRARVDALVAKVMAHSEARLYPGEDYTQYTVRGHYEGQADLTRYFQGALWLSRHILSVDPAPLRDPDAPLREAVALAAVLRSCPGARETLRRGNAVRGYLAGAPNAVSAEQLIGALDRALGAKWSLPAALQPRALAAIRREVEKPAYPRARVHTRHPGPTTPFPRQVVALLPDLAIPDSVLFQSTVHTAIPWRRLPTGLEVGAALGSGVARQEIQRTDPRARQVLAAVDRHAASLRKEGPSLYNEWLHVLSTLFAKDRRVPEFMRGAAWRSEKLNTCLASWAQLRHNHILYGAHSYATLGISEPRALVEPIPPFYRALARLAGRTRRVLAKAGALSPRGRRHLDALVEQCSLFAGCAEAQLAGTLTAAQADRIAGFGDWLKRFDLHSKPVVVDVATGMQGEVLHAATGALHELIVVPNRTRPALYAGWVMSYYEFVQPPYARLTDAGWVTLYTNPYLRPARPEWTRAFVHGAGAKEWKARAPLRRAGQLLARGRTQEGLAALRRVVSANHDSPLATEAQYAIGKLFFDSGKLDQAEAELRRCERLYGCDASDAAERLLQDIRQLRRERERADPSSAREARSLVAELKRAALPADERRQREMKLASLLLTAEPGAEQRARIRLVRDAAAACSSPPVREALRYATLAIEGTWNYQKDTDAFLRECRAFAENPAHSEVLRAAALALAVKGGLHAKDARRALDLLAPYARLGFFDPARSEALACLIKATGGTKKQAGTSTAKLPPSLSTAGWRLPFGLDPAQHFRDAVGNAREKATRQAYYAGRLEESIACSAMLAEALPNEVAGAPRDAHALDHFGREPSRLYALALGLENGPGGRATAPPRERAERFLMIYRLHSGSKLAPFALWDAAERFAWAGDTGRADETWALLVEEYGGSYPGLARRAAAAMAGGHVEEARRLCDLAAANAEPRLSYSAADQALWSVKAWLQKHDQVLEALAPLAAASPQILKAVADDDAADLAATAGRCAAAAPDLAADIFLALLPLDAVPVAVEFLQRFPDHPRAGEVWRTPYLRPPLPWLVAMVNRGLAYPYWREAFSLFERRLDGFDLGAVRGVVRQVHAGLMGTRAAHAADYLNARVLANAKRPEEALRVLQGLPQRFAADDPLRADAENLARRCRVECWGKRQPEWQPVWTARTGDPGERSVADRRPDPPCAPLAAGGLVIVPTARGAEWPGIAALDRATGSARWSADVGAATGLHADAARLYCGIRGGSLVALDLGTGRELYRQHLGGAEFASVSPVTAGDTLLVSSYAGRVVGLVAATGAKRWEKDWDLVPGAPAVRGDTAYLATTDGRVLALDVASGAVRWEHAYPRERWSEHGTEVSQPVLAPGDAIVIRARPPEVLDAATGAVRATMDAFESMRFNRALLVAGDEVVGWGRGPEDRSSRWPSADMGVASLPDLKLQARLSCRSSEGQSRAVAGRVVYVAEYRWVRAIDAATGAVLASWEGGSGASGPRLALGRHVYVCCGDGQVVALPLLADPLRRCRHGCAPVLCPPARAAGVWRPAPMGTTRSHL